MRLVLGVRNGLGAGSGLGSGLGVKGWVRVKVALAQHLVCGSMFNVDFLIHRFRFMHTANPFYHDIDCNNKTQKIE